MTTHQEYIARRTTWTQAALADETLTDPERRCKRSYARKNQDGNVEAAT